MVVGVILDNEGNPVCSELWPGNTTDVKTLLPIVKRLKKRFGINRICIVADRGMISGETIKDLEDRGWASLEWNDIIRVSLVCISSFIAYTFKIKL
jgi:transposase